MDPKSLHDMVRQWGRREEANGLIKVKKGIIQSMSRKGDCWPFEEFSAAMAEYIDCCNNERIQAETKWMPPV